MTVMVAASLVVSAFGVVAGLVVFGAKREPKLAVGVALELWTAAGLLRLTAEGTWRTLTAAGAIIAVRKLVVWSMRR